MTASSLCPSGRRRGGRNPLLSWGHPQRQRWPPRRAPLSGLCCYWWDPRPRRIFVGQTDPAGGTGTCPHVGQHQSGPAACVGVIVSFTGKEIDASIRWVLGVAQSMRSGGSRMGSDGLLDGRCSMKTGPIECIEGSLVVSGQSRDCFLSCGRGAPPVHHRPDPGPGGPCGPSPACATGWILSPGRYGGCFTSHIRKKAREHAFLKLVAKAGSRPLELGGSATTLAPLH